MLFRYSLLLLIWIATTVPARACDACGCSTMIWQAGFVPYQFAHQFGWQGQWVRYQSFSNHSDRMLDEVGSQESYWQLSFNARWQLNKRWALQLNAPYRWLTRELPNTRWYAAGWGDPITLLSYTALQPGSKKWRQSLAINIGSSLPFGQLTRDDKQAIDQANFRLGTGSIALLIGANHILRYQRWGWRNRFIYRYNGTNDAHYRYGQAWQFSSNYFLTFTHKKNGFSPSAGISHEQAEMDIQNNFYRNDTGGYFLFGQLGLQWLRPRFSVQAQWQHPLKQDWANELTVAQGRMSLQWTYFITPKQTP